MTETGFVLAGGWVVDGTGKQQFRADVTVCGERIVAVGPAPKDLPSIDACGLVVAPGFIDIHSHTDIELLITPTAESKVSQGVTTEVSGNCGCSPAPRLTEPTRREHQTHLNRFGLELSWQTLGEFLNKLEDRQVGVNYATFVGHGDLRADVLGYRADTPTAEDLQRMSRLLEQAMEEGAFGLSTGLIYPPGCFAQTEELVSLARIAAQKGGLYASHVRNEGARLEEAVEEALSIGRRANLPVQISHHKACRKENWGKVHGTLAAMEHARRDGLDVACDQYPYTATSTSLKSLLPDWAHEGGREAINARLLDSDMRRRLADSLRGQFQAEEDLSAVMVSEVVREDLKPLEGLRLTEVAARRGGGPVEAVLDLLVEDDLRSGMVFFCLDEGDVEVVMQDPRTSVGSDASARATSGPLGQGKPHPRTFGTFARVLGRYVRERRVISLEEAVRRMTALPASRLGLRARGSIQSGNYADLVIFDPHRIDDRATFEQPHQLCVGIVHVLVNGQFAMRDGSLTGCLAGQVLRRG